MATSTLPASRDLAGQDDPRTARETDSIEATLHSVLMRLASLKITVTVLIMAIILVVVGTLAQVDQDVWQVVDDYFRAPLAWIDLKVFFPPSFFPGLSVPNEVRLPGGYRGSPGILLSGRLADRRTDDDQSACRLVWYGSRFKPAGFSARSDGSWSVSGAS